MSRKHGKSFQPLIQTQLTLPDGDRSAGMQNLNGRIQKRVVKAHDAQVREYGIGQPATGLQARISRASESGDVDECNDCWRASMSASLHEKRKRWLRSQ